MFILASSAVTFLNSGPQFSVFMLGCVNKVLPWDKLFHKLITHKGQLGFYEKHESENGCWCSCVQFSTASQATTFESWVMWTGAWRCNVTVPVVFCCVSLFASAAPVLCPALLKGTKTSSLPHTLQEQISRQHFYSTFARAVLSQQNYRLFCQRNNPLGTNP